MTVWPYFEKQDFVSSTQTIVIIFGVVFSFVSVALIKSFTSSARSISTTLVDRLSRLSVLSYICLLPPIYDMNRPFQGTFKSGFCFKKYGN